MSLYYQSFYMAEALCLGKIMAHLPKILEESSHYFFQFGRYKDCIDAPSMNYNLIYLGIGEQNSGLYFGLCLPSQCTSKIIKTSLDKAFEMTQLPFNVLNIDSDIQDYSFPYTPLFYITAAILLILTLLVLFSTFLYRNKQKYLKSFALQQSVKFFQNREGSDLNIFNGIRAFAMMWVVFGHVYLNSLAGNVNTPEIAQIFKQPFTLIIEAGLLSVDVFFFLGGFFLAFVFLRQKSKSILKYPMAILQRVLRIWPCYIMTMLIYFTIFMHLGSGPRWNANEPIVLICKDMYRAIFFLDNLIDNGQQQCLAWGWYLQVDFQIFLICLLLLFLYSYKKQASIIFSSTLVIGSWIFNVIYTQKEGVKLFTSLQSLLNFQNYFLNIYIKPYSRWSPYILGLMLGILFSEYSSSAKEANSQMEIVRKCHQLRGFLQRRRAARLIIEWTGIALMAFLAFIPRTLQNGAEWPQIVHSLYLCFSRVLFNIGIILTLGPSLLGLKCSFFRTILDTSLFNYIAKISFCGYLVHYIILSQVLGVVTIDTYYSISDRFIINMGILILTFAFATIMVFVIEVPFATLQKEFIKKIKRRQPQRPKIIESLIESEELEGMRTSIQ